jgi:tricorn protease-like protein
VTIPSDSLRPVITWRTPTVYEVFDQDGRFLGRVAFPPRTTLMEADGNTVWAIGRNEDDLPAVSRYRIEPALQ